MLNLRTARLAVEAERADTEADLTMARLQLAGATGIGTEKAFPRPSSLPTVSHLSLPASSSDHSWPQRRLKATIPRREQAVIDQAAAMFEADGSRAVATADFLAGRAPRGAGD